ncbi:bifunctional riboflavin kinase/FAD synthetase [Solilutibacter tolerans]|uniref:Riboflavin biosynthesis protein n=1 Tax=Solilutibacter tolerans TaxID=1604334 RepID=A0A1N6TA22_9GAMM|nr:bifunctional riboflavin kinase/FAD synthetase [Lysobacter tolerans]SIQ50181.1 FMN adenylyltransferase /riboflavin kinase [Lysobacter tolerans]
MDFLFRDAKGGRLCPQGSVVCIGAFDGLHLGHQALLRHAVSRARALGLPTVALAFEPLPREFFAPDDPPPRLMLPRGKVFGMREAGIDGIGLLRFSHEMVAMSAADFIQKVLVDRLGAREVWVGPGFRFGHKREGDLATLQLEGTRHDFTAQAIEPFTLNGERVSSSVIRAALSDGDFMRAETLLGRPYSICGRVVRGKQLGRTLGFPTANLRFARKSALQGIYATRVHGIGAHPHDSVSSFGTRPTVDGIEPLLEAHVFDFDGDLYGQHIDVEFVAKIRDEEKFDSLDALTARMRQDAEIARTLLSTPRTANARA